MLVVLMVVISRSYGYRGADIEVMRGVAVHQTTSNHPKITLRDLDSGRLKQLDSKLLRPSDLFRKAQGKEIELSFVGSSILHCTVEGVDLCSPMCLSGNECEEWASAKETRKARLFVFMWLTVAVVAHVMLMINSRRHPRSL